MHIKRLIERFLRDQGLPPTKFGRLAARDPRLVLDIRMGREIRPEMEAKLRDFIGTYDRGRCENKAKDHE
nr:hypothetical protein [uncultured Sphingorhabdus sp.]